MEEVKEIVLLENVGVIAAFSIDMVESTYSDVKIIPIETPEELKNYLERHNPLLIISDLGQKYCRRSEIMELSLENCKIPLYFLQRKPQYLNFCDRLGTKYKPLNIERNNQALFSKITRAIVDCVRDCMNEEKTWKK